MDQEHVNRRAWLQRIIDERFDGVAAVCGRVLGKSNTQMWALLNPEKSGGRAMGEKTARGIEETLGLRRGVMDTSPDEADSTPIAAIPPEGLSAYAQALPEVRRAIDGLLGLPPERQADIAALIDVAVSRAK